MSARVARKAAATVAVGALALFVVFALVRMTGGPPPAVGSVPTHTTAVTPSSPAAAARPLSTGFFDPVFDHDAAESGPWLVRARQAGAQVVRIGINWRDVAKRQPASPSDPTDPAYRWDSADRAVAAARAQGLRVLLQFGFAPPWAEGPGRPGEDVAPAGTWRPDPGAYRAFATAAARRYRGRVDLWQAWNEPNLWVYLTPQWTTASDGGAVAASPSVYRALLNAFSDGVKSVDPRNVVVSAGTGPYGDPTPGGRRMPPVNFVSALLCLDAPCADPPRFDVLAHHIYSAATPTRAALNPGDVAVPDVGKLTELLRRAGRPPRLWITEFGWDTNPPDPDGLPLATQAQYLSQAMYELWRQGVDLALWYEVGDGAPEPSYDASFQSGVFFRDGRAKPSLAAFRLPSYAERRGARVFVWAKAPGRARTVAIERQAGAGWVRLATVATVDGIATASLALDGAATVRVRSAGVEGVPWPIAGG